MFHTEGLTGYPAGNLEDLFLTGTGEALQYGIYFAVILTVAHFIRKKKSGCQYAVSCLTAAMGFCCLAAQSVKAECMMSVMFALTLILVIYVFEIITFTYPTLILMFTAFLFPQRLFNSSFGIFGYGVVYLVIWIVLMSFAKMQNRQENNGCYMPRYVLFTCLALVAFLYKNIENINYNAYRIFHRTGRETFALFEIGIVLAFIAAVWFIKKKVGTKIQFLMLIDRKYPAMKKWILGLEIGTVTVILLIPLPFVLTRTVSDTLQTALAVLDILLLAMSAYVARSGDMEMKKFYKDKICPLIEGEIEQNTVFSKLYLIPSEELRAFLYMKCMEAFQRGIMIKLAVNIKQDGFFYGMELVDLTRILGILLDNSIEECESEESGFIEMSIRAQNKMVSYSIKNGIRQGHGFGHMAEQKSDKAGHEGRGLKIVRNILQIYPDAALNTFVDKGVFRQTLNLM